MAELLRGRAHVIGGGGERLTPTGAALLMELAESFDVPGAFVYTDEAGSFEKALRDAARAPAKELTARLYQLRCHVESFFALALPRPPFPLSLSEQTDHGICARLQDAC